MTWFDCTIGLESLGIYLSIKIFTRKFWLQACQSGFRNSFCCLLTFANFQFETYSYYYFVMSIHVIWYTLCNIVLDSSLNKIEYCYIQQFEQHLENVIVIGVFWELIFWYIWALGVRCFKGAFVTDIGHDAFWVLFFLLKLESFLEYVGTYIVLIVTV